MLDEIVYYIVDNIDIKYIFICLIIFCFFSFIFFIVVSYALIKLLKVNIDNNNVLFYQYNKKSKEILDKYGDHKLTKLYLVRQPLAPFVTTFLNIFTLYSYNKLIAESQDNFPYHTLLVCEVTLTHGQKKWLMIEKNNCINITDNFFISNTQETKELNIKKLNISLNSILNQTQERIGNHAFFNWHLYTNNCQIFTKELLKTINKYSKHNEEFIFKDKLLKLIIPSEFMLHLCNCICILHNIIVKYIVD